MPDRLTAAQQSVCALLTELTGFTNAVFVQSGTAALELALAVLTRPKARVAVPGLGCWTVPFAVTKLGRKPMFLDIDECWGCRLDGHESVSASITIDPWGAPGDWSSLSRRKPGHVAIGDLTQAPGARINGKLAAQFFDAAILSFGWGKPIALGGGGCVLFADGRAAEEASRYLRFGFCDGAWVSKIDRYTFSPFLFPFLQERLATGKAALAREGATAEKARRVFKDASFTPNLLRPGGQWGLWSVLPLRIAGDLGLTARELETVAVSSGVPLVRHPVSPAYREPAWDGGEPRPHCAHAEALAANLVCFERINHQSEFVALRDFLDKVENHRDQFRMPFHFPHVRGQLSAELGELARRSRLACALDGKFYLLDEFTAQKIPLAMRDAALVQKLQQKGGL